MFEGAIEPLEWTTAVYTIRPLPVTAEAALAGAERLGG
jgi:hypothetical protein